MITRVELTDTDFETAYRIAKARGMAERARVFRSLASGAAGLVRGIFARPDGRADAACAEC